MSRVLQPKWCSITPALAIFLHHAESILVIYFVATALPSTSLPMLWPCPASAEADATNHT